MPSKILNYLHNTGQYLHTVAIGFDQLGAAILFNRNDLTISSLSGLVLNNNYTQLNLNKYQIFFLKGIGKSLNLFFKNHTSGAIVADNARANSTINLTK